MPVMYKQCRMTLVTKPDMESFINAVFCDRVERVEWIETEILDRISPDVSISITFVGSKDQWLIEEVYHNVEKTHNELHELAQSLTWFEHIRTKKRKRA